MMLYLRWAGAAIGAACVTVGVHGRFVLGVGIWALTTMVILGKEE